MEAREAGSPVDNAVFAPDLTIRIGIPEGDLWSQSQWSSNTATKSTSHDSSRTHTYHVICLLPDPLADTEAVENLQRAYLKASAI